jgi:Zn-dependent alcohol dehydrogenase
MLARHLRAVRHRVGDLARLLSLYREGKLLLDETVTAEYKLNDIN